MIPSISAYSMYVEVARIRREEASAKETYSTIRHASDVAPFAGYIVAYQASSNDLTKDRYSFDDSPHQPHLLFGYIGQDPYGLSTRKEHYTMCPLLLHTNENSGADMYCTLSNAVLQADPTVKMRFATVEELCKIARAVQSQKALFEPNVYYHHISHKLGCALQQEADSQRWCGQEGPSCCEIQ